MTSRFHRSMTAVIRHSGLTAQYFPTSESAHKELSICFHDSGSKSLIALRAIIDFPAKPS
jgi:hypothetical protein